MKIQGPQLQKIQAYQQQLKNKYNHKQKKSQEDELNISSEAKKLQKKSDDTQARSAYIDEVKKAIQTNTYEVDYEETAKKLVDFWQGN